jgi:23S rRNA (adenine2503-C2)-methyltransferase
VAGPWGHRASGDDGPSGGASPPPAQDFPPAPSTVRHVTADGGLTQKVLLTLDDGKAIESVLLCYPHGPARAPGRATVCVSTQAG